MRGSLAESGPDPLGHGSFEHLRDRSCLLPGQASCSLTVREASGGQRDLPGPEAQLSFKQMPVLYYLLVMVAAPIQGGVHPAGLVLLGIPASWVAVGTPHRSPDLGLPCRLLLRLGNHLPLQPQTPQSCAVFSLPRPFQKHSAAVCETSSFPQGEQCVVGLSLLSLLLQGIHPLCALRISQCC